MYMYFHIHIIYVQIIYIYIYIYIFIHIYKTRAVHARKCDKHTLKRGQHTSHGVGDTREGCWTHTILASQSRDGVLHTLPVSYERGTPVDLEPAPRNPERETRTSSGHAHPARFRHTSKCDKHTLKRAQHTSQGVGHTQDGCWTHTRGVLNTHNPGVAVARRDSRNPQLQTPTPCNLQPTTYPLLPRTYNLQPTTYNLPSTIYDLQFKPYTLNPTPYTLNSRPQNRTLNPTP